MLFEYEDAVLRLRAVFRMHRTKQVAFGRGRAHASLAFRVSGSSRFVSDSGDEVTAGKDSIAYLPAGADHTRFSEQEELLVVHLDVLSPSDEPPRIEVMTPQDPARYRAIFERLCAMWEERERGYYYACTALLYQMLGSLVEHHGEAPNEHRQTIAQGVAYLHRSFRNPTLRIADAARQCHISEAYFRRLYKEIYHISPGQALNDLRMQYACALLEEGVYSVKHIAEASGFSDVKYFRTAFRRRYGVTCSQYRAGLRGEK